MSAPVALRVARRSSPAAIPAWAALLRSPTRARGADVVINYLPDEEADAQEVALTEREGRKVVAIPGGVRD